MPRGDVSPRWENRNSVERGEREYTSRSTKQKEECVCAFSSFGKVSPGSSDIYSQIDSVEAKDFENLLQSTQNEPALSNARDFKARVASITSTYDCIYEDIVEAVESKNKQLPSFAVKDTEKAVIAATQLYHWAETFVPSDQKKLTKMSKEAKFQIMPYLVAMAYAVRVKADAYVVECDTIANANDQAAYLKRSRKIVDEFIAKLKSVVTALTANTTMLDIALDYHLPLSTYLTVITSLRAGVDALLSPAHKQEIVGVWNDGLSSIR